MFGWMLHYVIITLLPRWKSSSCLEVLFVSLGFPLHVVVLLLGRDRTCLAFNSTGNPPNTVKTGMQYACSVTVSGWLRDTQGLPGDA